MDLRYRIPGAVMVACSLGACYGTVALWPAGPLESPPGWTAVLPLFSAWATFSRE